VTLLPTGAGDPRRISVPEIDRIVGGVGFFPDGQHLWLNAAEAGHSARAYLLDIEGGKLHPGTPEGVLAEGVSLDGNLWLAPTSKAGFHCSQRMAVAARIVPGLASGLDFVQWGPGGKSLYVRDNNNLPTTVFQVDVSTGQKRTVRQLMPADPSGIRTVWAVAMSPDGKSYAYNYFRQLSQLLVVEGLK